VNREFFQGGYQILDHSIGKKVSTLTTDHFFKKCDKFKRVTYYMRPIEY
jgi:hypothetical protein